MGSLIEWGHKGWKGLESRMHVYIGFYESPLGRLAIMEDGQGIARIGFGQGDIKPVRPDPGEVMEMDTPLIKEAASQLEEYFAGRRKEFDLPLSAGGTQFQRKVWDALRTIPFGETRSYGQLAAMVGNPKACRAVGGANNRNPIIIIVPCHRVVGHDGSLVGYGGGLPVKKYLLELERRHIG